ncbi:hypothetical protein BvCmsKSNP073_03556 [Escherichia coli]|nr:hypothetical protein BvCmsKSNP073_03556 [Escherichia coli]
MLANDNDVNRNNTAALETLLSCIYLPMGTPM